MPVSVAGFGFRAAASLGSLVDALERAGGPDGVTLLAAPADKVDADCLRALAERLALDIASVSPEALAAAPVSTRSLRVLALRATGSVAEAAALAAAAAATTTASASAATRSITLLGPRAVSADRLATCALAIDTDGTAIPGSLHEPPPTDGTAT